MKKILFCFSMPHGSYCGGVASVINSYLKSNPIFLRNGINVELYDYIAPDICERQPSKVRNVIYGLLQCRELLKRLKEDPVNLVHIHTSCRFLYLKDILLARAIKKHRNIPVFLTIHVGAAQTVFARIGFSRKQTIRWINRYVDQAIFLCDSIRREFENLGMLPEKGITSPNFHDLAPVDPAASLPAAAGKHLLYVGALHRDKGILDLLKAMRALPDLDIHLDICGELTDLSIREPFEDLVRQLGHRVSLHGYVRGTQKSALFDRADMLLLPSYHEGFPLVVLEALASGCGLILTPMGALPEILTAENTQWIRPGDVPGLAEAIRTLCEDPGRLAAMKAANRERGKAFSLDTHIAQLCEYYNEM